MKTGRPRKNIDKTLFEDLCRIHCTEEEILGVLHVSDKTLVSWCKREYGSTFSDTYKKYSAEGKMSLRRWQIQAAKAGSVPMLIWLGKQWLGQSEPE